MNKSFSSDKGLDSLNSVLGKVVENLGINRGLKQITLLNFWPQMVGKRFEKNSKAVSLNKNEKGESLVVTVSSASVSQELLMFKGDILRKLHPISKSLGFNINDIIFNTKLWNEVNKEDTTAEKKLSEVYVAKPTDEELNDISVPENIVKSVLESVEQHEFTSTDLKDRMIKMILNDIKTQIWKKNKGFPSCVRCGTPINFRNLEGENLCPSCKYNS